jgi:transposase-like protein
MPLPMPICPHCSLDICVRELPYQGLFKSFRICPNCGESFTVDTDTKYRQAACIVIAVISLVFTLLLYYRDSKWLIPALVSYVVLGLLIYWGNKKVFFVPYQECQNSTDDT